MLCNPCYDERNKMINTLLSVGLLLGIGIVVLLFAANSRPLSIGPRPTAFRVSTDRARDPGAAPSASDAATYSADDYEFQYPSTFETERCTDQTLYVVPRIRQFDPCQSGVALTAMSVVEDQREGSLPPEWLRTGYSVESDRVVVGGLPGFRFSATRVADSPAPLPERVEIIQIPVGHRVVSITAPDQRILSTFVFRNK